MPLELPSWLIWLLKAIVGVGQLWIFWITFNVLKNHLPYQHTYIFRRIFDKQGSIAPLTKFQKHQLLANTGGLLIASAIILISFVYPETPLSFYTEINNLKNDLEMCVWTGVVLSICIFFLHITTRLWISCPIVTLTILTVMPSLGIPWTSPEFLHGTIGKILPVVIGVVIFDEGKRLISWLRKIAINHHKSKQGYYHE
jgi:hypothetical protein